MRQVRDCLLLKYNKITISLPQISLASAARGTLRGTIAMFSDAAGTNCNVFAREDEAFQVYIFHMMTRDVAGIRFSIPIPACLQALKFSEASPFTTIQGNSTTGMSIDYETCPTWSFLVLTVMYYSIGVTEPCCRFPVLPDPRHPLEFIEALDCSDNWIPVTGGRAIVNPNSTCPCIGPVPIERTTWGQLKALYQ